MTLAPIQPSLFAETQQFPDPDPELMAAALRAYAVAVDVETQTEPKYCTPAVPTKDFGLAYTAPMTAIAVAWLERGAVTSFTLHAPFTEAAQGFIQALLLPKRILIAHNAVFDMRQLSKFGGIEFDSVWCTQVMARLLTPFERNYDLASVATYSGIEVPNWVKEIKKSRGQLHLLLAEQVRKYVAFDAETALQIYEAQQRLIDSEEMTELSQWETAAITEYCRMAGRGIRINREYTQARITELIALRQKLWRELTDSGCTNPGSSQACVKYIYQIKQVPLPKWYAGSPLFTDKGHERLASTSANETSVELGDLSADKEALEDLMLNEEYAPLLQQLKDFKEIEYTCRTLESLLDHAALDGRIHSMINVATVTGRRSSTHPNIQNLRFGGDSVAGDFSGVFVAEDGYTLVEIDYSNAENWIAAMISGDNNLAAACSDSDFHSAMSERYFKEEWAHADAKHRKMLRRKGKSVTFGAAYGQQAKGLSVRMKITFDEAKQLLRKRELAFPDVIAAFKAAQAKAESESHINLWTGRLLPVSKYASYTAFNYCCQGGVGEMIKRSIVLIMHEYKQRGLHSYISHDMHDALVISVHHDEWDTAIQIVSEVMENVIPAELNQRTEPPIQWIARPNLSENAGKWGKFQPHPTPAPEVQIPTLPPEPVSQDIPEILFTVSSLGFEWRGKVRLQPEVKFSDWSPAERVEAARFFCDYIGHVSGMLRQVYEVYLPAKLEDGTVGLAPTPTGVDMTNWAKIPALWLKVAEQGIDVESILELSTSDLLALHNERQAQVASIQRLSDTLLEYLARIPSEKHEEGSEVVF